MDSSTFANTKHSKHVPACSCFSSRSARPPIWRIPAHSEELQHCSEQWEKLGGNSALSARSDAMLSEQGDACPPRALLLQRLAYHHPESCSI